MTRLLLNAILTRFVRAGRLTVTFPDNHIASYGPGGQPAAAASISSWRAVRGLLTNPALVFGEAFVNGEIEPVDCRLEDLLRVLFANLSSGTSGHPGLALRRGTGRALRKLAQYNPIPRSKKNVEQHYDLNGRLYSLFLDRDRQYSCAYFARGDETLEEAQAE